MASRANRRSSGTAEAEGSEAPRGAARKVAVEDGMLGGGGASGPVGWFRLNCRREMWDLGDESR